jgi:hypothetical protein
MFARLGIGQFRRLCSIYCCLPAVFALISGCGGAGGPALAHVQGKVTKGGKPLANISVTFTQTDKNFSAGGMTNEAGEFVLVGQNGRAGALPGKNKVTLTTQSVQVAVDMSDQSAREQMMKQRESAMSGGKQGAPAAGTQEKVIPAEYSHPTRTPLSYDVKAGDNSFDIPIP